MGHNLNCDLHLTKINLAPLLYFGCSQLRVGNLFCTDTSGLRSSYCVQQYEDFIPDGWEKRILMETKEGVP